MSKRYILIAAAAVIWIVAAGGGMTGMWMYSFAAGTAGNSPLTWPMTSHLHRSHDSLTLVMVVHPHCPCSRASIGELARLLARSGDNLHGYVIFVAPPGTAKSWSRTDLWESVSSLHKLTPVLDDGREARLFGAATSGQVIVYGSDGRRLFSGGITASRGHFGDNSGSMSIIALSQAPRPATSKGTPVYGCPLFSIRSQTKARRETCHR
jgi:hypothetical protein